MDKIQKALKKLNKDEREKIKETLLRLKNRQFENLNIKKLKGRDDIFRIRKGRIRIMYRTDRKGNIFILTIERRSNTTYR